MPCSAYTLSYWRSHSDITWSWSKCVRRVMARHGQLIIMYFCSSCGPSIRFEQRWLGPIRQRAVHFKSYRTAVINCLFLSEFYRVPAACVHQLKTSLMHNWQWRQVHFLETKATKCPVRQAGHFRLKFMRALLTGICEQQPGRSVPAFSAASATQHHTMCKGAERSLASSLWTMLASVWCTTPQHDALHGPGFCLLQCKMRHACFYMAYCDMLGATAQSVSICIGQ